MEREHQNVQIGKQIHEERYKRDRKNVSILNTINVDFIREGDDIVLHEIKKTRKMEKSHCYQLYFYLDFLQHHGIEAKGEINYPLLNKKVMLELTEEKSDELQDIYQRIQDIVTGELPPARKKNICPKCAYYEFCFGEEQ